MNHQNALPIVFSSFVSKVTRGNRIYLSVAAIFLGMAALQTGQDFMHAYVNSYRGYLSESLLFKSYWILFIPIVGWLFARGDKLRVFAAGRARWVRGIVGVTVLSVSHIALAAGFIVLVSRVFFHSPFPFFTPFRYFISEHFYLTMFFYAVAFGLTFCSSVASPSSTKSKAMKAARPEAVESITVTIQNKRVPVSVKEIIYIRADKPYLNIQTPTGRYLHTGTLKEMLGKLEDGGFIRVHRSTILNRAFVAHFKSRSNGDYDVTLKNGEVVRMSRNYYASFRAIIG